MHAGSPVDVQDYVLWYEVLDDGLIVRKHGRVVQLSDNVVWVMVPGRDVVPVREPFAASASTLAELDYKLQGLREAHPMEEKIRRQVEAAYGPLLACAEVRSSDP